jgi:hypothetical protein
VEAADGYYTPTNMMPLSVTAQDIEDFEIYGSFFRQSLIWGLDSFPMSPFFIIAVLADLDSSMTSDFINAVAPLSALRLATWPPREVLSVEDNRTRLDLDYTKDPMKLINSCLEFTEVCFCI